MAKKIDTTIKIDNLTGSEVLALAKAVVIGTFIMENDDNLNSKEIKILRSLEDKFFDLVRENKLVASNWFVPGKVMNKKDLAELTDIVGAKKAKKIVTDSQNEKGKYYLSMKKFEELIQKYVEPRDEEQFWDELEMRLGQRDMMKSKQKLPTDTLERLIFMEQYYNKYAEEFEDNGIERLQIVEK